MSPLWVRGAMLGAARALRLVPRRFAPAVFHPPARSARGYRSALRDGDPGYRRRCWTALSGLFRTDDVSALYKAFPESDYYTLSCCQLSGCTLQCKSRTRSHSKPSVSVSNRSDGNVSRPVSRWRGGSRRSRRGRSGRSGSPRSARRTAQRQRTGKRRSLERDSRNSASLGEGL